jgi:hypothetical protein
MTVEERKMSSSFQTGLDLLRMQRDFKTPELGSSIDVLERLVAGQADGVSLGGVINRLPLMARIAVAVSDAPDTRGALEQCVREIEGAFSDLRIRQARKGFHVFGDALKVKKLDDYLSGTDSLEGVPQIPVFDDNQMAYFDHTLLRDGRLLEGETNIGLKEVCRLAGLLFSGSDSTFAPHDSSVVRGGISWIRFQDGRCNHNRKPADCRKSFEDFETGADVIDGIASFVQDELVLWKHYMDLPGSVRADGRDDCACLGVWHDGPELRWGWGGLAHLIFGSASRGK